MKTVISSSAAPAAIGPYSQAIRADKLLFVSGQVPIDPATGKLVPGGPADQARQSLKNLAAILAEAGGKFEDVVKATVFITDMAHFAEVNEVYASHFAVPFPARSCVAVKALPLGCLVEVEVIAYIA